MIISLVDGVRLIRFVNRSLLLLVPVLVLGCATKIEHIAALPSAVEFVITNPKRDGRYYLIADGRRDPIGSAYVSDQGIATFDVSSVNSNEGECMVLSDGKDPVQIAHNVYYFDNPARTDYIAARRRLQRAESELTSANQRLNSSVAYSRVSGCQLPDEGRLPTIPSNACRPGDESTYSQSLCASAYKAKTFGDTVKNSLICGVVSRGSIPVALVVKYTL